MRRRTLRRFGVAALAAVVVLAWPMVARADTGADVAVSISGPAAPVIGSSVTYTYTATNAGPEAATDAIMLVQTGGSTFSGGTITGGPLGCGTGTLDGDFAWECRFGTIAAGGTATVTFTTTVARPDAATLRARLTTTATDPDTGDNDVTYAVSPVRPAADVSLTASAPANADTGGQVQTTFTAHNPSSSPLLGVTVTGSVSLLYGSVVPQLPANSANCSTVSGVTNCTYSIGFTVTGTCQYPTPLGPNTFSCTFPMAPLSTVGIRVLGRANASGTATSTAHLDAPLVDDADTGNHDATATTVLRKTVDLSVDPVTPGTVTQGASFTFAANVRNLLGPEASTDATVTTELPLGIDLVSAPAGCSGTRTVTCALGSIAVGATTGAALTLRGTALRAHAITVTAGGSDPERNAVDNSAVANVTVTDEPVEAGAHLRAEITGPASPQVGQSVTYTYTVTNDGPDAATDTVLLVQTGGSTFAGGTIVGGALGCRIGLLDGDFAWSCSFGTVASGDTAVVTFTTTVAQSTPATLRVRATTTATDPEPDDNDAAYSVTPARPVADLALTGTAPATAEPGAQVETQFSVTNPTSSPLTDVTVTGAMSPLLGSVAPQLPANSSNCFTSNGVSNCTYRINSTVTGTCRYPSSGPNTFSCTFPMDPNATVRVRVFSTAVASGTAVSTAQLETPEVDDPDATDHDASATTAIGSSRRPDLTVTHTSPATAVEGSTFDYVANVVNESAEDARVVFLLETLPTNVTYLSSTGGSCTRTDAVLRCGIGTLAAGDSRRLTFTVRADDLGAATATAEVSTADVDPDLADNTADATTAVVSPTPLITCPADVSTTTDPGAPSAAGVVLGTATATDGTPPLTITATRSDGAATTAPFPAGTTEVAWTVTDAAGATATCRQSVTVADDEAPALATEIDPAPNAAGWNNTSVTVFASAADNVGVALTRVETPSGFVSTPGPGPIGAPVSAEGTTTVTALARDAAGNETQAPVTVRIDTDPPSYTCAAPPSDWVGGDVTLSCTATDDGSGVVGATTFALSTSVPAGAETADARTGTQELCDEAGNCTTAGPIGGIRIDRRAPSYECDAPDSDWHGADVSLGCSAQDGGSGLASPASFSLTTSVPDGEETADARTDSRELCDRVGNCTVAGPIGGIRVDRKRPDVRCGTADADWHADDVELACTAADAGSGLAPADTAFTLATHVPAGTETADAATGTRDVCDTAGNCATAGPVGGNKVDKRAPSYECDAPDSDWHGADVSLGCSAQDGGSGLASPATFSLTTSVPDGEETADARTDSRELCDRVGNCTVAGPIGGIRVDRKRPDVRCGTADADWHADDVELACTAADAGSGLAPADTAFTLATHVPAGTETADAATGTRDVCDTAGNCTTAGPIAGNKVDKLGPAIRIAAPADGSSWILDEPGTASVSCADGGSGLATCDFDAAFATDTVGPHAFTATATDAVGNPSSATSTYAVVYSADCADGPGRTVLAPLRADGSSVVRGPQSVPVKFRVCDFAGRSIGAAGVVASFEMLGGSGAPSSTSAFGAFRFTDDQWHFDLATRELDAGRRYEYRIGLNDGTSIDFGFFLR